MVKVTKTEATEAIQQAREALVRARVLRAAIDFIESNSEANAPAVDVLILHDIANELSQQALAEVRHVADYFWWEL